MFVRTAIFLIALVAFVLPAQADGFKFPFAEPFKFENPFFDMLKRQDVSAPKTFCRVKGKTRGLNPTLKRRLCVMSHRLGPVQVVSGCRKRGSRRAPNSYHKISRGCKAADIRIAGHSCQSIRAYWNRTGGGGTGCYRRKSISHVDVGTRRSWNW